MLAELAGALITGATRLMTGVQGRWLGCAPSESQRLYFANHASHLDFVLVWSVLPPRMRRRVRPVAADDYWNRGRMRKFLIHQVFRGVLIARGKVEREHNPLTAMCAALDEGDSLLLFPEGTRGTGGAVQPFKSGVFQLALAYGELELVPVWIDNAHRVMPKGTLLPLPLLCSVAFGAPMKLGENEGKMEFLERLRRALVELGDA
ncbi:lysophospholipid acyltransferase family protein [Paludibaculum fermentans]|uniref:1-acyl-sn-glycerol-3-phosphate acyltransferase n=1 Tax=Paludibaculum fermentans TaxID=1473598 RepID=A0A7S7NWW6_PALFE|nr:lysophospholipid acyltransferase family protein [Paludibaculum fermentans]QOY91264.1 1-acyl-sn-glycerol-3-phosphate acyltransferase [Paludibaculum fermentans]